MPHEMAGNAIDSAPSSRGHRQRAAMAGGEQLRLVTRAAAPDRADGVNDPLRVQLSCAGRLRVAGLAAAEQTGLLEQGRAGCAVDRPVDATATKQRRVRGIDDCVRALLRYVAADDLDQALRQRPK